jgi:hypothetical protein
LDAWRKAKSTSEMGVDSTIGIDFSHPHIMRNANAIDTLNLDL